MNRNEFIEGYKYAERVLMFDPEGGKLELEQMVLANDDVDNYIKGVLAAMADDARRKRC